MEIELLDKQIEFMEIPHKFEKDVAIYQGGFGSGKTFCGALLGILLSLKYQKLKNGKWFYLEVYFVCCYFKRCAQVISHGKTKS